MEGEPSSVNHFVLNLKQFPSPQASLQTRNENLQVIMGLSITDQTFVQHMMCAKALSDTKTVETYNLCLAKAKGNRAIKARDIDAVTNRINRINEYVAPRPRVETLCIS